VKLRLKLAKPHNFGLKHIRQWITDTGRSLSHNLAEWFGALALHLQICKQMLKPQAHSLKLATSIQWRI
jgi:hypothetical protein